MQNNISQNAISEYKIFIAAENGETNFPYIGNENAAILIGVFDENWDNLSLFLEKIMASVKVDLASDCKVARLSLAQVDKDKFFASHHNENGSTEITSFAQLSRKSNLRHALFFGIEPRHLGLNIDVPPYFIAQIGDCYCLFADKLTIIEQSADKKKALWNCLKTMFA